MTAGVHSGSCLCGQVRFTAAGPLADVLVCHCRQCRKMSGHCFAATAVPQARFRLIRTEGLEWLASSTASKRGFCRVCGSSLFFHHGEDEPIGIAAGAFDDDPPLTVAAHIYVDEAGPYYTIEDGCPQFSAAGWRDGGWKQFRSL
ncbi:MAG: GFA family protein [Pseudomonadota bacterium]